MYFWVYMPFNQVLFMTKEGDTDLKCVGLVDYCDKKLNDKLMLHFQENKSFHAT